MDGSLVQMRRLGGYPARAGATGAEEEEEEEEEPLERPCCRYNT
jgi:hypothetical protein